MGEGGWRRQSGNYIGKAKEIKVNIETIDFALFILYICPKEPTGTRMRHTKIKT